MPEFKIDSLFSNELVWYKVNMYLLSLRFVDLVRVCSHLCLSRAVSGKECMCWALGALRISCGRLKWDAVGCVGLGCHGVPVAGNTGLVGGSILASEVILSTRKLNKIQNLHATSDVLQYQAGCILQDLQEYVAAQDCILPIDLGSKAAVVSVAMSLPTLVGSTITDTARLLPIYSDSKSLPPMDGFLI